MAQFERVTYQRVFNLGNYESVRIGADVLINLGEDAKQALNEAKEFVEQWRKENNAYHFADTTPDLPIIPKKTFVREENTLYNAEEIIDKYGSEKDKQELRVSLADQIQTCTSIKVLESYKFIVKGKKHLEEIYNNKLKELQ